MYNMHHILRNAFLGQNCAYYMQNFTVVEALLRIVMVMIYVVWRAQLVNILALDTK